MNQFHYMSNSQPKIRPNQSMWYYSALWYTMGIGRHAKYPTNTWVVVHFQCRSLIKQTIQGWNDFKPWWGHTVIPAGSRTCCKAKSPDVPDAFEQLPSRPMDHSKFWSGLLWNGLGNIPNYIIITTVITVQLSSPPLKLCQQRSFFNKWCVEKLSAARPVGGSRWISGILVEIQVYLGKRSLKIQVDGPTWGKHKGEVMPWHPLQVMTSWGSLVASCCNLGASWPHSGAVGCCWYKWMAREFSYRN